MYNDQYEYAYLAVAKTGSRTMYDVLKTRFGGVLHGDHRNDVPKKFLDYFVFATVRNPYDRSCSAYQQCFPKRDQYQYRKMLKERGKKVSLENFLGLIKSHRKANRVTTFKQGYWIKESNKIDRLIHTERLNEEFNKLPFVTSKINLPMVNARKDKHHPVPPTEDILTLKAIALINEIYESDFELLDYPMIKTVKQFKRIYR
jgi:hypothetical protein